MARSWMWIAVFFRMIWKARMMKLGPEQNAEARNRGARIEAFQNGRLGKPL